MRIVDETQPYNKLDNVEGYGDLYYTDEDPEIYYEPFIISSVGNVSLNLKEAYCNYLKFMTSKNVECDYEHNISTKNNLLTFYISSNIPLYVNNENSQKYKTQMQLLNDFSIQCPDCKFKKTQLSKLGNIIFKNIDSFTYIDGSNLEKEKFEFVRQFVKMFNDISIGYSREYEETFNFQIMTVVEKKWEPGTNVNELVDDMKKQYDNKNFRFMVIKNKDKENIKERVEKGLMPLFAYPENEDIDLHASKYLVLKAYINLCNENPNSYPFCTPDRLLNLVSEDMGFQAPDYKTAEMIYKRIDLQEQVTCVEFDDFDDILLKYMYLVSKEGAKPLLINLKNTYYVCYDGEPIEVDDVPVDIFRNMLISHFEDPENFYLYKGRDITQLVRFTYDDEEPIFMEDVFFGDYKNPKTGNYLGYLFWEAYDNNYHGIYKSILGDGHMDKPQRYNANLMNDKIKIQKQHDGRYLVKYDEVPLSKEMVIDSDDLEKWLEAFKRWWSIGLFLSTYGLCYYKKTNIILKKCIKTNDFIKYPNSISSSYEILKFMESY